MPQNTDARKKAAKEWSKRLKDLTDEEDSMLYTLQGIFKEIKKRVAQQWNSNERSTLWREYFVAALRKLVREIPGAANDISIEDLCTEIERMNLPAEPTATPNGNDEARKPLDTASIGPSTNTTFKVDTQGDYKTRVVEDGTTTSLEFLLNGPATVVVQTIASPTAAASTAAQLGIFSLWKR